MDMNPQGRVGDAADEEKIWTTAMEKEKEKERERARSMRRTAVAGGSAVAKTTMTEMAVGGVDNGAPTTVTTVTMVTAMTMT